MVDGLSSADKAQSTASTADRRNAVEMSGVRCLRSFFPRVR